MFDIVGLQMNAGKMVRIICRSLREEGTQSDTACERRMTGEGITYRERQRVRVKCLDCGE